MKSILITGGAGFIGSAFLREALRHDVRVVVYDSLTYAGHMPNIEPCLKEGVCDFVKGDIRDSDLFLKTLQSYSITQIVNFAAESHVDNSILGPQPFFETNVMGTLSVLESSRAYLSSLPDNYRSEFRLVHVSTDEVFGELGDEGYFTEENPYRPNSPYSASKAASDHMARAWYETYKLPVIITNCSNNYGPRQFPEKLIPRMIVCALNNQKLPVYGQGNNIRDWIHVEDHAHGVWLALTKGRVGQSYCFGGRSERRNLEVVERLCAIMDQYVPKEKAHSELITFVTDRAGHDWRYAIDDSKSERELGFERKYSNFETGLKQTVEWYLESKDWLESVIGKQK